MAYQERTEAYKIYEWLRYNMYERVDGVRQRRENSPERLEELIEEAMEKLYILHREQAEERLMEAKKARETMVIT